MLKCNLVYVKHSLKDQGDFFEEQVCACVCYNCEIRAKIHFSDQDWKGRTSMKKKEKT